MTMPPMAHFYLLKQSLNLALCHSDRAKLQDDRSRVKTTRAASRCPPRSILALRARGGTQDIRAAVISWERSSRCVPRRDVKAWSYEPGRGEIFRPDLY